MYKANTTNEKIRVRGQYYWSYWLAAKPVLESFSDIQCVFLEDSRRHCIFFLTRLFMHYTIIYQCL